MSDLPTPANSKVPSDASSQPSQPAGGMPTKEKEGISTGGIEAPALKEVGREAPLPPEVTSAGVSAQFTSVSLPPAVQQMGVQPIGDTGTQGTAAVALPLSDDQIAQGLHQGITSSWRWLAEWCVRKLKQFHLALKKIHGTFTRVKA